MEFRTFEARAHQMWAEIPEDFKDGVDGIVVQHDAHTHPEHPDYFTLGMCDTEPYPSGFSGPETTRSVLTLYWGSFQALAERGDTFDWEEELWETITHELRHHLEFLADEDALEGLDYAMEETYKRMEGEPFDVWYWQRGVVLSPGVYRVEYDVYIEQRWRAEAFEGVKSLEFGWDGGRWTIPRPEMLGEVHFVWIDGVETAGGALELVLVRDRTLGEKVSGLFRGVLGGAQRQDATVAWLASEAVARRIGDDPDSPGPLDGRPGRAAGGPPPPPEPSRVS